MINSNGRVKWSRTRACVGLTSLIHQIQYLPRTLLLSSRSECVAGVPIMQNYAKIHRESNMDAYERYQLVIFPHNTDLSVSISLSFSLMNSEVSLLLLSEAPVFRQFTSLWNLDKSYLNPIWLSCLQLRRFRGHVMILEGLLMFLGNEVNRPNADGDMPMHLAARGQHAACLDRLLNTNHLHSNIQFLYVQNASGDSPMHIVCGLPESPTKIAMVGRLLANARMNLHLYNEDELTPVHIVSRATYFRTMELILQSRPQQLNADTGNGFPPLLLAAFYGRRKCTEALIELNADVNRYSKLGRTALHLALETWHGAVDKDMDRLACVQALVQAGCPLNVQDCDGQTAAHLLMREMNRITTPVDSLKTSLSVSRDVNTFILLQNLHDIASRVRPHWQFACLCFLTARGADLSLIDRFGVSVLDGCLDERIRILLSDIVEKRPRSCLPMTKATFVEFDPSGVTMCTFNCEDSQADVCFVPCGHRVVCKQCARSTPLRRCPLCYQLIAKAISGQLCRFFPHLGDMLENASSQIVISPEKLRELEELREKLAQLEMETSCTICMDIVFNCGHTACSDCTPLLKSCHICRQVITKKQTLYA
ncbi:unnamed protein product [Haemonchus placei]|uniref:RING-type domain-containing protein n=1 Tax=Haemonchus placei TaxID=6290 RepID=A0A3P7YDS5_HAEPC|nr:unnamed protein product [Haemonchus placei]